jgi:hypothetical protein
LLLAALSPLFLGVAILGGDAEADPASGQHLNGAALYGQSGWEISPLPADSSNDLHVACFTASSCLASDDNGSGAIVLKTVNGGVTWNSLSDFTDGISSLSCYSMRLCMATHFPGNPHLEVTSDAGALWSEIGEPPFGLSTLTPESVACSFRFCIVVGSEESGHIPSNVAAAALTTDLGNTWQPIALPPKMSNVQAMSCAPTGKCFLVYDTSTHQFSDIAFTKNQGKTWVPVKKAPGFTSSGSFSCPSSQSCIYLGTKVLEVTTNGGNNWKAVYGPFSHVGSTTGDYSFSLSCQAVAQCMIGGIAGATSQQVVWTEGSKWSGARLATSLRSMDRASADVLAGDEVTLGQASGTTAIMAAFNTLLSGIQSNAASAEVLALHATGRKQVAIAAIGKAWVELSDTFTGSGGVVGKIPSLSQDKLSLTKDVNAISTAERRAGDFNVSGIPIQTSV